MGRGTNKKSSSKRSSKGNGPRGAPGDVPDGREARRLKRADERAAKRQARRERLGRPSQGPAKLEGHDKASRKLAARRRLEVSRLQRAVAKQQELLRAYRPPPPPEPELDPELKRKRRQRDFYDLDTSHWTLKGAACPAASRPGAWGSEGGEGSLQDDMVEFGVEDLFAKHKGAFLEGPEPCRMYIELKLQLALTLHDGLGSSVEAVGHYESCLELDAKDGKAARRGLVRCLLDTGEADKARAVVDRFPEDRGCVLSWSLAAIEYVSWALLKEEGSSEAVATAALERACAANPFVPWYVAHREVFDEVVEHIDEIESPREGSVEEAFWYCHREMPLWADLEGAEDWVRLYLLSNEVLPPVAPGEGGEGEPDDVDGDEKRGNSMYAGFFETAVGMAAEQAQMEMKEGEGAEEDGSETGDADGEVGGEEGGREEEEGDEEEGEEHDEQRGQEDDDEEQHGDEEDKEGEAEGEDNKGGYAREQKRSR